MPRVCRYHRSHQKSANNDERTARDGMAKLSEICALLESFAPLRLAEEWDNVGLLVGDRETNVDVDHDLSDDHSDLRGGGRIGRR